MTVDLLETRLRELDVPTPDAGRVSAKVLARRPGRRSAVNTRASSSGYTITLHGAYADSKRTVLLMHVSPAAMPHGFVTDQFARSYRMQSAALNTDTGDVAVQFEGLAFPDSVTGARITVHVTDVSEPPSTERVGGTWELTATVGVDVARSLPVPAGGDLGPAHFRFTSASYTPGTVEVDGLITGVSPTELGRIVPDDAKGEPALQLLLLDPNGQVVLIESASAGDQNATEISLVGYRTIGGNYTVRVSYYGYGSFERTLKIAS